MVGEINTVILGDCQKRLQSQADDAAEGVFVRGSHPGHADTDTQRQFERFSLGDRTAGGHCRIDTHAVLRHYRRGRLLPTQKAIPVEAHGHAVNLELDLLRRWCAGPGETRQIEGCPLQGQGSDGGKVGVIGKLRLSRKGLSGKHVADHRYENLFM